MTVYLIKSDRSYYKLIEECASSHQLGVDYQEISSSKFLSIIQTVIRNADTSTPRTFIVDGNQIKSFEKIIQV